VRQNKLVLVSLICLVLIICTSQVSAKRLYSWGTAEDIRLDVSARSLHSYDGFDFIYNSGGFFDVFKDGLHQGRMSFGVFGELNGEPEKRLMSDFTWSVEVIENSSEHISIKLNNNFPAFYWEMDLNLGIYSPMKITHKITNNTGHDITSAQLFYIIDTNQISNPNIFYEKFDGTIYAYNYSTNWHFTNQSVDFADYYNKVRLGSFQFLFQDLIDTNFFITRTYFGNLSNLDVTLPDTNGFALGFSKGNQTITNGQTIISDPTIKVESDDLDGRIYLKKNKSVGSPSTTEVKAGHDAGIGSEDYWYRAFHVFDLENLSKISSGTLHLRINNTSFSGGKTVNFDLNSIIDPDNWGSSGLDFNSQGGDWNSINFSTVIESWFDETVPNNSWVSTEITSAWNENIENDRNYLAFRLFAHNDILDSDGDNDAFIKISDTGLVVELDPYIEYEILDVNLNSPTNPNYFGYLNTIDGNKLIDFNVFAYDSNYLLADIYYSSSTNLFENLIVKDLNLYYYGITKNQTIDINCDTNDFTTSSTNCIFDFNFLSLSDGNYFIDLNIHTDNPADGNMTTSSNFSLYVDSTIPSTIWDANELWQNSDVNVHLTCVDAGSCDGGDSNTSYRLDSDSSNAITYGSWLTYDANILFNFGDGNWAIDFNSTDYVGNIGDVNTFFVLLDATNPVTSNLTPTANTDTTNNEPTFTIDVSDALSGLAFCHYEVFKNEISIYSGVETATAGTCSHQLETAYALAVGQTALIQWDVNDTAENITADENSFSYNRIESGGEGGGGGGATTFIFVETQKVFSISVPKTSQLIYDVYPEYKKFETFTLQNDLDSNQLLLITVSDELYKFLQFDDNQTTTKYEFKGLEKKDLLYVVDIPINTQIKKYFGTITLQDANRTTEIKVTINVKEKPPWTFITEWLQQETKIGLIGIPNLIIVIVGGIILYLIFLERQQNILNARIIKNWVNGWLK